MIINFLQTHEATAINTALSHNYAIALRSFLALLPPSFWPLIPSLTLLHKTQLFFLVVDW